jgi:hypothetical protein
MESERKETRVKQRWRDDNINKRERPAFINSRVTDEDQKNDEEISYRVTFDSRAGGARLADFGQRSSSFGFSGSRWTRSQ